MASGPIHFLHPGDINAPTGGYVYDRRLIAALRAHGTPVTVLSLGGGFPLAGAPSRDRAEAIFSALPDGAVTVVDGLAYGALDTVAARHGDRLQLIALVHHPLALETGLSEAEARRLAASERAALAHARAVVTTSPATAESLAADFGVARDRLTVILPGLDPAPLAVGRDDGRLGLLAVGSLIPRKDYATLLAALKPLADRDWHLDIAGSAEFAPDYASSITEIIGAYGLADRITLHGAVGRDALEALYVAADLFVLTTRYEGYGMAFTEAMAHGLPVVATGDGAVRTTVPESAGRVVAAGDVDGVRRALAALIDDPDLRQKLRRGARDHVATLPTWRDAVTAMLGVIESLT